MISARNTCVAAMLAVVLLTSAFAGSYSVKVPAGTSSYTILGSVHNLGTASLAAAVMLRSGGQMPSGSYSASINQSTYDVAFSFLPATSDTVMLYIQSGLSTNTTASTDFLVTTTQSGNWVTQYGTVTDQLIVCANCTQTAYARRTYNGGKYSSVGAASITVLDNSFSGYFTGRAYIEDNILKIGVSIPSSWYNITSTGNVQVVYSQSSYPAGVTQLGHVTFSTGYNNGFYGLTDDRPLEFK